MSEKTAAERNEEARQTRTEAAIAANDATEESQPAPKPAKKKKKKVVEKKGVGDTASERRQQTARVVTGLREKFERAMRAGNTAGADDLRNRIKAVIAAGE